MIHFNRTLAPALLVYSSITAIGSNLSTVVGSAAHFRRNTLDHSHSSRIIDLGIAHSRKHSLPRNNSRSGQDRSPATGYKTT